MMGYYLGWSPYHYVLGDPTWYTDPSGMWHAEGHWGSDEYSDQTDGILPTVYIRDQAPDRGPSLLDRAHSFVTGAFKRSLELQFPIYGAYMNGKDMWSEGETVVGAWHDLALGDFTLANVLNATGNTGWTGAYDLGMGLIEGDPAAYEALGHAAVDIMAGGAMMKAGRLPAVSRGGGAVSVELGVGEGVASRSSSEIRGFTPHAVHQSITRGFKTADILKIVNEGMSVEAMGRYGPQIRVTLGGNTVVINARGKVVTVFSNAPGTANELGKGFFIPFE